MEGNRQTWTDTDICFSTQGLFEKIGPIKELKMVYDRAGRSEGTAYVTYESHHDAMEAIREYDRANAAGTSPCFLLLERHSSGVTNRSTSQASRSASPLCLPAPSATHLIRPSCPDGRLPSA